MYITVNLNCVLLQFNASLFSFLQYFSEYKIAKISIPMLFLSGQKDELIPPVMMQSLYSVSRCNI